MPSRIEDAETRLRLAHSRTIAAAAEAKRLRWLQERGALEVRESTRIEEDEAAALQPTTRTDDTDDTDDAEQWWQFDLLSFAMGCAAGTLGAVLATLAAQLPALAGLGV